MSEVLTQNEIDELLSALAVGNDIATDKPEQAETERVRPYNFQTANRFPKEQIRMFNLIFENYAGRLSTFLSGTLRAMSEVEVVSIEEQTYSEYSNSLPAPVLLAVFDMPPLAGSSLVEVSSAVAYEIISRLLGGTFQSSEDTNKQYTEIEISILTRILQQMLSLMNECWEKVVDTHAILDRIETSAQFAQVTAANEPIVIITMNVKIAKISGIINFCIPHVAVQPIAKLLGTKTWYNETAQHPCDDEQISMMSARITSTQLALHAMFDSTVATAQDIVSLQVGDVIRIDHHIDQKITVKVEHITKFKGTVGLAGQRVAIKIAEVLKEEDQNE